MESCSSVRSRSTATRWTTCRLAARRRCEAHRHKQATRFAARRRQSPATRFVALRHRLVRAACVDRRQAARFACPRRIDSRSLAAVGSLRAARLLRSSSSRSQCLAAARHSRCLARSVVHRRRAACVDRRSKDRHPVRDVRLRLHQFLRPRSRRRQCRQRCASLRGDRLVVPMLARPPTSSRSKRRRRRVLRHLRQLQRRRRCLPRRCRHRCRARRAAWGRRRCAAMARPRPLQRRARPRRVVRRAAVVPPRSLASR